MTHTPGPWKAIRTGGELTGSVFAGKKRICSGICDDVRLVKEAESNSALIEAAPDMLRALEAVYGESEESDYLTQAQIQVMCRSAIQKARGEE